MLRILEKESGRRQGLRKSLGFRFRFFGTVGRVQGFGSGFGTSEVQGLRLRGFRSEKFRPSVSDTAWFLS